jgi:hypothetical protein
MPRKKKAQTTKTKKQTKQKEINFENRNKNKPRSVVTHNYREIEESQISEELEDAITELINISKQEFCFPSQIIKATFQISKLTSQIKQSLTKGNDFSEKFFEDLQKENLTNKIYKNYSARVLHQKFNEIFKDSEIYNYLHDEWAYKEMIEFIDKNVTYLDFK